MQKDEYLETLVVNGKLVPVGIDDYGQCYFFEYVDADGNLQTMSCGTYNENYKDEIKYFFETPEQRSQRTLIEMRYQLHDLHREVAKLQDKLKKVNKKLKKK